jgi:hypothetical protein
MYTVQMQMNQNFSDLSAIIRTKQYKNDERNRRSEWEDAAEEKRMSVVAICLQSTWPQLQSGRCIVRHLRSPFIAEDDPWGSGGQRARGIAAHPMARFPSSVHQLQTKTARKHLGV